MDWPPLAAEGDLFQIAALDIQSIAAKQENCHAQ
jgi:hypothetical protein